MITRFGWLGVGVCIIGVAAGCSDPMVITEELYANQVSGTGKIATVPINGIPYYLPKTVLPIKIVGSFKKVMEPEKTDDPTDGKFFEYLLEMQIGAPTQVADADHIYMLNYVLRSGTDDEITVGTNAKQLLSTVDAKSEDQSGAIVLKAAQTIGEILKSLPVAGVMAEGLLPENRKTVEDGIKRRRACKNALNEFSLNWMLDLSSALKNEPAAPAQTPVNLEIETAELNAAISRAIVQAVAGEAPDMAFVTASVTTASWSGSNTNSSGRESKAEPAGLRFRVPRIGNTAVRLSSGDFSVGDCSLVGQVVELGSQSTVMMDPNREVILDMSRAELVKKQIKLTVADGVLQEATINKPSTALAAASLPLDLIKELLSPIAALLHPQPPSTPSGTTAGGK